MRFIVREQSYEKPIAAGLFRYDLDGSPTGAVESWRLTTAVSGYQILRVDLDARDTESGNSFLFHLVRQDDGTPERLGYRYWGNGWMIEGTLLFEDGSIGGRRVVNGRTIEETLSLGGLDGFWFPSAIGLGIAARLSNKSTLNTAMLNNQPNQEDTLALKTVKLAQEITPEPSKLTIGQKAYQATQTTFSWQTSQRVVYLDTTHQWPIKIAREDGLTAVETRHIWY